MNSKKAAEAFCQMMERHGYFTSRLGDDGKGYYSRTSKWPPADDFEPDEPVVEKFKAERK